jgi:hypothetical protein
LKVLDKKGFKLPYVDSQIYRELMRLGLQYDRQQRTYSAEELDAAGADSVLELLSRILHETVCFEPASDKLQKHEASQACLVCGRSFQCNECRYCELCETKDIRSSCICGKCLEEGKVLPEK